MTALLRQARVVRTGACEVEVRLMSGPDCAGCGGGCAAGLFSRLTGGHRSVFRLPVPARGLRPDMTVLIECPAPGLLKGVLLAFGLPLTGLLAGAGVAALWARGGEAAVMAGLAAGLTVGVAAACRILGRDDGMVPDIRLRPVDDA